MIVKSMVGLSLFLVRVLSCHLNDELDSKFWRRVEFENKNSENQTRTGWDLTALLARVVKADCLT